MLLDSPSRGAFVGMRIVLVITRMWRAPACRIVRTEETVCILPDPRYARPTAVTHALVASRLFVMKWRYDRSNLFKKGAI
jgi:hypothetical protein